MLWERFDMVMTWKDKSRLLTQVEPKAKESATSKTLSPKTHPISRATTFRNKPLPRCKVDVTKSSAFSALFLRSHGKPSSAARSLGMFFFRTKMNTQSLRRAFLTCFVAVGKLIDEFVYWMSARHKVLWPQIPTCQLQGSKSSSPSLVA